MIRDIQILILSFVQCSKDCEHYQIMFEKNNFAIERNVVCRNVISSFRNQINTKADKFVLSNTEHINPVLFFYGAD